MAKHQAELAAVRAAQQPILLQVQEVGKQYADVSEQLRGIHARWEMWKGMELHGAILGGGGECETSTGAPRTRAMLF